jgi:DNA ligase 1
MLFKDFSQYLQKLEQTSARLDMTSILAELFQKLEKKDIKTACYLMQGRLVPRYESLEFQLSIKMIIRALARLKAKLSKNQEGEGLFGDLDYSGFESEVGKEFKRVGDVGLVSENIRGLDSQRTRELEILEVYEELKKIAKESGEGSQERKVNNLADLLLKLDPASCKFVTRIVLGKMRLGFSTMTILDSLSWSAKGDKSDNKALENAYQKKADVGLLAELYLSEKNIKALDNYSAEVGVPIVPALCQRLNSAKEIIDTMGEVLAEPKYDGLRIQIHVWGNKVRAYTRNLEEVSHMFPELNKIAKKLNCENCVLDAEAIGVDVKTGNLVNFQETITRKRKHGVDDKAKKLPIRFYVFDCLILNNKSLINKPLLARKKLLDKLFEDNKILEKTEYIITKNAAELKKYHENQLGDGLEGAVIKKIDSEYKSGRKGWRWVKIKEGEGSKGKLSDTLDCVVMGYYFGKGKRTEFGIGAFLAGVIGKKEQILTLAKIGTGLTDEQLKEFISRVKNYELKTKPNDYQVHKNLAPDVWVDPGLVVEIAADEITKSPVHTAGVALRFPRLVKFRGDKAWHQATSVEELKTIK